MTSAAQRDVAGSRSPTQKDKSNRTPCVPPAGHGRHRCANQVKHPDVHSLAGLSTVPQASRTFSSQQWLADDTRGRSAPAHRWNNFQCAAPRSRTGQTSRVPVEPIRYGLRFMRCTSQQAVPVGERSLSRPVASFVSCQGCQKKKKKKKGVSRLRAALTDIQIWRSSTPVDVSS